MSDKHIFDNVLSDEEYEQIESMLREFRKGKNLELEVGFKNISYVDYMRISEYYVDHTAENNISGRDSLDISIEMPDGNTYRVSIADVEKINWFIKKFLRASVPDIQRYLLSVDPSDEHEIMFKDRGSANRLFVEDFAIIFKTTSEIPITKTTQKPVFTGMERMLYRYKNRYSFVINDDVRIDITSVQESSDLRNLLQRATNYEVEMEITNHKISLDVLLTNVANVLTVTQDSQIAIGKKEIRKVIQQYSDLLGIKATTHLDSRNVISVEAQHIVNFIPNRYAVTDKADGERYFLFIIEQGIYLLSTNLEVKKVDLPVPKKVNIVLDGELIKNKNGLIYMAFDVVHVGQVDYRFNSKYILTHRINVLNNIIDECFGTLVPFVNYTEKHDNMELDKIKAYNTKAINQYWNLFKETLKNSRKNGVKFFVSRKIYFVPYGIDSAEVFMYADLIWKLSVYDKLPPYKLDGIIYTPINAPYLIKVNGENLDSIPLEYKWKNPQQNSIDFYIRFELDTNGVEAIYYDNSVVKSEGKPYKICSLFVGVTRNNQEKPVPFKVNGVEQKANIYLTNGEARDSNDNIINDKTVVEFIFDQTKTDINDAYKWIPIKTRYDKTESVQKFGRKYGNNLSIANRIWRTIMNPITEETIAILGNPSTYEKEMAKLRKSTSSYNEQSFVYYQKKTAVASGMRAFNNWIKSNMILTYASHKKRVLDIGCGRGGDLIKFINAKVGEYVGIDIDNNGLYIIEESAYDRYQKLKRTDHNVPPMYFINADARALFNVKAQENALPNINSNNKSLIQTYLSGNRKYDIINCQFSIHYYLSDELSWSNFCKNLLDHIAPNGYFLVTCFDGKLIHDKLIGKSKLNISYTNNYGNKITFFEINKIYSDATVATNKIGLAIDLYNSIISNPGTYITEYLVFPDFLEKSLKEKCGLELVETDSFFNLFNLYKNYFIQEPTDVSVLGDISGKRHREIRDFYLSLLQSEHTDTEVDEAMASFKLSMLNRYYIFKKTAMINIDQPARIVGMNNQIHLGKFITPYFEDNHIVIDPEKKSSQINKIYHAIRKQYSDTKPSIYLIRHSITEDEFATEQDTFRRNKLEFAKVKEGADPKILLIYKSPEKYFYPVCYQRMLYDDTNDHPTIQRIRRTYLFDSEKIVNDLDILVALNENLYKK